MEYPTIEHVQATTDFKSRVFAEGAIEALKWLEKGAPHKLDGLKGNFFFNMIDFVTENRRHDELDGVKTNTCGTACCIAGAIWAFAKRMNGDRKHHKDPYELDAAFGSQHWTCGADSNALTKLFYVIFSNGKQHMDLEEVTPTQAAITLRQYLETGIVNWDHLNEA